VTTKPTTNGPGGELTVQLNQSHGSFELVLSPLILALLGLWLDRTLGTGPWLTIAAAVLGLVGASVKIYFEYRSKMAAHAASAPWASATDVTRVDA
jgi:F0F1-type ATP synthase assembly protein I